jgi:26S proteasome regulatory subunit N3
MPERRSLRSNKADTSSSSNGDKARSNSQSSSSNKDKPHSAKSTSSRSKSFSNKKGITFTAKDTDGEQPHLNGSAPTENGVDGVPEQEADNLQSTAAGVKKSGNDKDGDEEMTVVVPPSKASKSPGSSARDAEGDTVMNGTDGSDSRTLEDGVDPQAKAVEGERFGLETLSRHLARCTNMRVAIKANFSLLERAVSQFDPRFTLRVLRSISSIRKQLSADMLAQVISDIYAPSNLMAKSFLDVLGKEHNPDKDGATQMDVDTKPTTKNSTSPKDVLPEIDIYISILCQIHLYDARAFDEGTKFSDKLVEHIRTLNRRTLDSLSARVYFYYSLFYEHTAPLPPSPVSAVISIRQNLLTALRTATLRKDQDIQATVTTLLLRNYLSTSHISQADLLINHTSFPPAASNNQIARFLYYLGRIRAIQLNYSEAHDHLLSATRKSPSSYTASGFYQASTKLLVVVELLMGDIPDRAIFRQPSLERAMQPYLQIVQAVNAGGLENFNSLVQKHNATFRRDGTYTLILRLRQNVIKTGIRTMSLSYSRIRLRDIVLRLGLKSEESAEYIVGKAIRDDVIEATLDHEDGYMKSKDVGDVYATREPGDAFHDRIRACLALHDESVKVCCRAICAANTNRSTGNEIPHESASFGAQECSRSTRARTRAGQGDCGGRDGRG